MRRREKPSFCKSAMTFVCSPLRPTTTGAKISARLAFAQAGYSVGHLVGRALLDFASALGTMRHAEYERIADADSRISPWAVPTVERGFRDVVFGDRDRGRKTVDAVEVGLVHLPEELAGVGRQAFHIPALAFRIDGVEGQLDLPLPERPVMTTSLSRGMVTLTFFRLCSRAPLITMESLATCRTSLQYVMCNRIFYCSDRYFERTYAEFLDVESAAARTRSTFRGSPSRFRRPRRPAGHGRGHRASP